MTVPLSNLVVAATEAEILATALGVAEAAGLDVTSWRAGDPTRSLYLVEAKLLAKLEEIAVLFAAGGFLDYIAELAATNAKAKLWLRVLAYQQFGVDVPEATYATTSVVLTNPEGGLYEIEAGDLTFKNSATGKTYRNTTGGTLASGPGTTLTVTVVADEAGSDSSALAGEIDDLVTTLGDVTCTNPAAAVGDDEQDPATTVQQCRDKQGILSPNGPADAYAYIARSPSFTGTTAVTRSRVFGDKDTGDVTLIVASPTGPVPGPDVALVEVAILKWAVAICDTPEVQSAAGVTVSPTYTLWLYKSVNKSEAEVKAAVGDAFAELCRTRPIGGDVIPPARTGALYAEKIKSTIANVFPASTFRVALTSPGDTALANNEVPVAGTLTGTIIFVADP